MTGVARSRAAAFGLALLVAACGGSDGGATTEAPASPTTTAAPALTRTTLPGGAAVAYPSDWTSFGEGFSGSLELGIPGVANLSIRDAAASEYLYGPQWPNAASLDEAFAMAEFAFAGATVGEPTTATVDGVTIVSATVDIEGTQGMMAVAASGDSHVSLYAASTDDGPLPADTVAAILKVLASVDA